MPRPDAQKPKPVTERHLWEITALRDVLWFLFALAVTWAVYTLRGVFIPVFIAWLLAYLVNPIVQYAHRRWSWPRPLTVSSFLVLISVITAATIALVGPLVSDQVQTLVRKMPGYAEWMTRTLTMGGRFSSQAQSLLNTVLEDPLAVVKPLFEGTGQAFGILGVMVGATMNAALLVFLVPLYFFFFSWHFDRMLETAARFIPRRRRAHTVAVLARMDAAVSGFFRERLLIALMTGVMYAVGWALADVPYWFILGISAGVLTLVPYLTAIGWPLAILFKYLESLGSPAAGSWLSILIWPSVAYLVVQFIESWILTPWIQRKSSDMSAVTLLIVLFIGGAVGGLFGLIFAIPIAACIKIAFEELVLPQWTRWAADH
jgi:predicted PurR-regulated permease PerM